jgi:hypothetical protein
VHRQSPGARENGTPLKLAEINFNLMDAGAGIDLRTLGVLPSNGGDCLQPPAGCMTFNTRQINKNMISLLGFMDIGRRYPVAFAGKTARYNRYRDNWLSHLRNREAFHPFRHSNHKETWLPLTSLRTGTSCYDIANGYKLDSTVTSTEGRNLEIPHIRSG